MAVRTTKSLPLGRGMFEREFIADSEVDVASIDTEDLLMGSSVFVIDTGNAYILNGSKQWKGV